MNLYTWLRSFGDDGYLVEIALRILGVEQAIRALTLGFEKVRDSFDSKVVDLELLYNMLRQNSKLERHVAQYEWVKYWPIFRIMIPQAILEIDRIIREEQKVSRIRAKKMGQFMHSIWANRLIKNLADGQIYIKPCLLKSIEPIMLTYGQATLLPDLKITPYKERDMELAKLCIKKRSFNPYTCLGAILVTVTSFSINSDAQLPQTARAISKWKDSDWKTISPVVGFVFKEYFNQVCPYMLKGFLTGAKMISLPYFKLNTNWKPKQIDIIKESIPEVIKTEADFVKMAHWLYAKTQKVIPVPKS